MFDPLLYRTRRRALAQAVPGALILLPGNNEAPIDFRANIYPFRQDGCFRYFFGLDRPGLFGLIDTDTGKEWLFGDDPGLDATIWLGPQPSLAQQAESVDVAQTASLDALAARIGHAAAQGRPIAYPPPYRADMRQTLAELLAIPVGAVAAGASTALIDAIVALREIKAPQEIAEMEAALAVTAQMHHAAMAATRPGVREHEVMGRIEGIARAADMQLSYQTIFSGRGEVLHNLRYDRTLATGELVVNDSGARSQSGYASDITRTLPVSGRFEPLQRRLYEAVLKAQQHAIAAIRPGRAFFDLHCEAAGIMVEALSELGLFRGDPAHIVASGAYAICFQCGLGHQIGLEVHDMEALGEDRVGYDGEIVRSGLFGLRSLRLGKRLKAGMTVTVEPGLYFIPQQIDQWRSEKRHADLIDYDRLDALRGFGGIRIEDDIVVTADGSRLLGPPIAKSVDEVEARMGQGAG